MKMKTIGRKKLQREKGLRNIERKKKEKFTIWKTIRQERKRH